ncbi:hypothetical protein HDU79_011929 [Rhizoclosmatium sp. JEL0117]|nr:hypothetical protein HDU79_011929 [Rhizoclosmatium sp. JEL0117]
MSPLETLVATLVDNTVLDKFEKGSKTLIDTIAANDAKFNEIKTLIETVEENEDLYTQLKEKINKFLETDNPLTDQVKPVLAGLAGIVGEIANTHPILKIVWLAVAAVYKVAKAMKEFDDKLLQLIEAFRKGKLFTDASLEGSLAGIGDASQNLLKDALETYIKCLNDLIAVSLDCYHNPKPDEKKQGFFLVKPKEKWNPSFVKNTLSKLDSILTSLREAKSDLTQAQTTATFSAVNTLAAQQVAQRQVRSYTLEQMDLLKDILKPVDFVSFKKKKVTGRTWFVNLVEEWLKGQGAVFWFSGPAGCGKSRMAETVFDLFENGRQVEKETMKHDAVFFAFNHKDNNDPKTCIETLAYSIAEKYNTDADFEITKAIFKKCETWSKEPTKKPQKLEGLIHDLLVTPLRGKKKNVVIVIDALDECEPKSLEEFLPILDSHIMRHFRFIVTSRDQAKLPNAEEQAFNPTYKGNLDDLTDYVQGRLKLVRVLSKAQVTDHTEKLVDASEGIFLNASIALDILGTNYSQYKIFETNWNSLMENKLTSDTLYTVVWSKVLDNEMVCKLVGIMLSLKRPLKVNGLSSLMDMDTDLLQMTITHIVPLLKGVLNNDNDTVQFKHRSTVEFLEKRVPLQPDLLAEKCMDIIGALLESLDIKDYSKAVNSLVSGTNKFNFGLSSDATLYFIENWTNTLDASIHLPETAIKQFAVELGHLLLAACINVRNESLFMKLVQLGASVAKLVYSDFFISPILYESAKLGLATVCECLLESQMVDVNCRGYTPHENPKLGEIDRTPLHIAVWFNHLETVKVLVEHNADIYAKDGFGYTPSDYSSGSIHKLLDSISAKRQEEYAVMAMAKSAMLEPNSMYSENTGYHCIAMYYDSEILGYVSKLSSFETGMSLPNSDGETPLFLAAKKGNKQFVEFLLDRGAQIELQNNEGYTLLALAAFEGHQETVELLINCGANIESQNKDRWTPLALATYKGHKETVEFLLNQKADIESQNKNRWTPLAHAASNGDKEIVELLLNCGANIEAQDIDGNTPLTLTVSNGHEESVELLLNHGANIEAQTKNGTPLVIAALNKHKKSVKLLLNHGANIEAQSKDGYTPLVIAAFNGDNETVQLLLDSGTNIELQSVYGITPLAFAAFKGHQETVELLLDQGANIESKNNDGNTPLALAAIKGHQETVKLLLEHGANTESKNNDRNTPLIYAANNGLKAIVQLLQKYGANIELQDNYGRTFLANSALNGHTETVELLLDCGASIECKDNKMMTPLALAVQNDHKETADLLRKCGALEPTLFQSVRSLFGF